MPTASWAATPAGRHAARAPIVLDPAALKRTVFVSPFVTNVLVVTVKRGDTVSEVADRYGVRSEDIVALNDVGYQVHPRHWHAAEIEERLRTS